MTDGKPLTMNPPPLDADESVAQKLVRLGIELPKAAAPVAAYIPCVEVGDMLYVSGQLPFENGQVMVGRLEQDRDFNYGKKAARACGLMILAQVDAALGGLDRVARIVKLNLFVNSDPRFTEQAKVANGASELMVEVFGEAGKHARAAVGVPTLPLGAVVEVDAIIALKPA